MDLETQSWAQLTLEILSIELTPVSVVCFVKPIKFGYYDDSKVICMHQIQHCVADFESSVVNYYCR